MNTLDISLNVAIKTFNQSNFVQKVLAAKYLLVVVSTKNKQKIILH